METITEDYVSFEVAKLLKEKGFKGQGEHFYENNKIIDYINYWYRITPKQRYEAIEAPTLQMAMKWLRKVHKIFIEPKMSKNTFLWGYRVSVSNGSTVCLHASTFNEYEESCESAIKYCLENLI